MDVLSYYLSGLKPSHVSSFGSLYHFKPSQKPKEAGDATRCTDCVYEKNCVWSAKKIYFDAQGNPSPVSPSSVPESGLTFPVIYDMCSTFSGLDTSWMTSRTSKRLPKRSARDLMDVVYIMATTTCAIIRSYRSHMKVE